MYDKNRFGKAKFLAKKKQYTTTQKLLRPKQ